MVTKESFDKLNESVNTLSDVTNDLISLFSNQGLANRQMKKYKKCKTVCVIIKILVVIFCVGIVYFNLN